MFTPTDTVTTITTGLSSPKAIAFTPSGSLVYVLCNSQLLTMPVGDSTTSVQAGNGSYAFADGQGTAAMFNAARGLVVHPVTGVAYITDQGNHRIRVCTPQGLVSTLAGGAFGNVDGDASSARFNNPFGIVMDSTSMYLYVTCLRSNNLRQVTVSTGYTITIAGSGIAASIDGQGLGASFYAPSYVCYWVVLNIANLHGFCNTVSLLIFPRSDTRIVSLVIGSSNMFRVKLYKI